MSSSTLRRSRKRHTMKIAPKDMYEFALRCAVRVYNEESRTLPTPSMIKKDKRVSMHSGVGDLLTSITDKFGDDSKPGKHIKEVLEGLRSRAKERDPSEACFQNRRFMGILTQFLESPPSAESHTNASGYTLGLITSFATATQLELKSSDPNPAVWFDDLNQFVSWFAKLVIAVIKGGVPSLNKPELMVELNRFVDTAKRSSSLPNAAASDEALLNFPMIRTVQELFNKKDDEHRAKLHELQPLCTELAYVVDLKKSIENALNVKGFPNEEAASKWKKRETSQLTQILNTIVKTSNLSLESVGQNSFTFIPSNPHKFYRDLTDLCITYDLLHCPEEALSKDSILSQQSDELLRECWRMWRISSPYRAISYLELVNQRFQNKELDVIELRYATQALDKIIRDDKDFGPELWASNDRESLIRVFEGVNQSLLHELETMLSNYWRIIPERLQDIMEMLDRIYTNPVYLEDHHDPLHKLHDLDEAVEHAAVERWKELEKKANDPEKDSLTNLLTLADKLLKELKTLTTRKFKEPIKEILHVPSIVMAKQMSYFALEIETWSLLPGTKDEPIDQIFDLYHIVLELKWLYDKHGPQKKSARFRVDVWFLSHVRRWLRATNESTSEWVYNAIEQDQFVPLSSNVTHSSSIVDLFTMFHQAVEFAVNLNWPDDLQNCGILTKLSKVIGNAIDLYTSYLEALIRFEMDGEPAKRPTDSLSRISSFSSFLRRTPVDDSLPPPFEQRLCVMMSDIEEARKRLDRLYQFIGVDEISNMVRELVPTAEKMEQTSYLYSIKIERGKNLQPKDNNDLSDPYVVLLYNDTQFASTDYVSETLNPRWDKMVEKQFEERKPEICAIVYDHDDIGTDDECGCAWFSLSPDAFDDYQTHELNLNLKPQGILTLQVTLAGEKDDIQFWFGKSFRTLKRAENDAAERVSHYMGRQIRRYLSRKTMKVLLGKSDHSSIMSLFNRPASAGDMPSLQTAEEAIDPLITYLETNLKVLCDNLSESMLELVVLNVWKEVLMTLENVLLPPLSDTLAREPSLDENECHVVFQWLQLLEILFNGGESGDAVPREKLKNSEYHALLAIRTAYNKDTRELIRAHAESMENEKEMKSLGGRKADRSKTVYRSKTVQRSRTKHQETERRGQKVVKDMASSDTILRILRMRHDKKAREFLRQEFEKRNNPAPMDTNAPALTHNHNTHPEAFAPIKIESSAG